MQITRSSEPRHLPQREGDRPEVAGPAPHSQLTQTAPRPLQEELWARMTALPGVRVGVSLVSVPGARALHLDPNLARGSDRAFQEGTEFAHLHPPQDGSLHVNLPDEVAEAAIAAGWGERHPTTESIMLYGPRDEAELDRVWELVQASYRYARGE